MTISDWENLRREIDGTVILQGETNYEAARKPEIPRFHDVRPQGVVACETPQDVAETVSFARRHDLATAVRSGGHCFAGRSSTEGVVIDVSPMNEISISEGVAKVGAGARLGDVYDALDEYGLALPAGCGPTVGISGLTLGGGLGILGRKYGLTADHLLRAQIVLADGRIIECGAEDHADLFWALRGGGGGGFGVVTSLTFDTLPAPMMTVFHLTWSPSHAVEVISAWQSWSPDAPDELAASLLLSASEDPHQPVGVNVFGSMIGTEIETANLLADLVFRVGKEPESSFSEYMTFRETKRYLSVLGEEMVDEPTAGHPYSRSGFFERPLPDEAIMTLVGIFCEDRSKGQARSLDFSPWGGAYDRVPSNATAFVHRDAKFLLKHAAVTGSGYSGSAVEAARSWTKRSWSSVAPWDSGGVYPNFPDPDLEDPMRSYYGANAERLMRVKASYDPDDFFRFHQSVPPLPDAGRIFDALP